MSVRRERDPEPEFTNFSGLQASVPKNEQIGFGNPLSSCYTRTTVLHMQADFDSLEFFSLIKSLKIRPLENYVCLLSHTLLIPSGLNLCQIVKKVHKT